MKVVSSGSSILDRNKNENKDEKKDKDNHNNKDKDKHIYFPYTFWNWSRGLFLKKENAREKNWKINHIEIWNKSY